MPERRITIFGSSHTNALRRGLDRINTQNIYTHKHIRDFSDAHVISTDGDPPALKSDIAEWAASLDCDYVLFTISGGTWLSYCTSNRDPKIDFVLPSQPDLEEIPGAVVIPFAEMRRELMEEIAHPLRGIAALRASVPSHIPIWYISPPPPIEDNETVRRCALFAGREIARHGVTDPVLRLKMYLLHSEILSEACTVNGVQLIPPPADALTETGFIVPECIAKDGVHANGRYGARVLRDVENRIETE